MLISVIIPTRNRVTQLKRTLDLLLEDEYPDKEIIVCDGASSDGTVELLKSYGDQVRWISEPDSGEYDARNKGLRLATGGIIKYMSDDDVLLPGSLAYAVEYFSNHPDVDILFGQSVWFDARRGREPVVCDTRMRTADSIRLKNFIRQVKPLVNSETAIFRRRVVERIGRFDITLHGADYEYWARAAKAGLKLDICDRVFVHYYLSDLSGVERRPTQMLLSVWEIARRYGDWTDQVYVVLFMLPFRLFVRALVNYVPLVGLPMRDGWERWKSRRPAS